jgi:transcription-repair coupling factor (superfamily II helicase)
LVFQAGSGTTSKVLARGLGVLPMEKQVEELMTWLKQMVEQIPGSDGLTDAQRAEQIQTKNNAVLAV